MGAKKLPVNNFQWKKNISKINETFIKRLFDINVKYPKNLHDLQSDLPFLPERIKITKF